MKFKHILLLSMSMALMGCQGSSNNSENNGNTGGNTDIPSQPATPSTENPDPDPETPDPVNPNPGTDDPETPAPEDDPNVNNTNWSDDAWKAMKTYIGGNIIPYIDIGKGVAAQYTKAGTSKHGYLTLSGGNEVTAATLATFKTDYEKAGWTADYVASSLTGTATLASKGLTVKYYADSSFSLIDITYVEPYDTTTISDWTDEIKTSYLEPDMHKHDIPFIYLGSTYMTGNWLGSSYKLTITQGNGCWNDAVLTNAKTVFTAAGWNPTDGTATTYSSTVIASKTFDDGCKISATVKSTSTSKAEFKLATLELVILEGYDPSGFTAWPSTFSDYTKAFGGHEIPLIYLGVSNPKVSNSITKYNKLTLEGTAWRDEMATNAETVLKADKTTDWEITHVTYNKVDSILAYTKFTDGCRMYLNLKRNGAQDTSKVNLVVRYEPAYTGSTQTEWDTATATTIYEKLGQDIPYVYMNSATTTTNWTASTGTLKLTGAESYNTGLIEDAIANFTKAEWTVNQSATVDGVTMVATKTFDNGTITATITPSAQLSNDVSMSLKLAETYCVPNDNGKTTWPTDVSSVMSKNYDGYVLPYIYLGTRNPTASTYSTSAKSVTITGGAWNDKIFDELATSLAKETTTGMTWTIEKGTHPTYGDERVATAINSAVNQEYTVEVYKNASSKAVLVFSQKEFFAEPTNGAWTSEITASMKTHFDDHYAPYVYLGTLKPTITSTSGTATKETYSAAYGQLTITGGNWDSRVLDIAKRALTKDGYTLVENVKTTYGTAVGGYKLNSDGTAMRVTVYRSGVSLTTATSAKMDVYYGAAVSTDTATTWASATQTLIDDNLGGYKLPYLSTGDVQMTAAVNDANQLKFTYSKTSGSTQRFVLDAMSTLNAADNNKWDFSFDWSSSVRIKLYGALEREDGSSIRICFYSTTANNAYLYVTYVPVYDSTKTGSFTKDLQEDMADRLGGYVLPYFYLNKDADKLTYTAGSSSGQINICITGGVYDSSMETALKTALTNDTAHAYTWSYGYDRSSSTLTKTLIATCDLPDGSYLTIKLHGSFSNTTNLYTTKVYVYFG